MIRSLTKLFILTTLVLTCFVQVQLFAQPEDILDSDEIAWLEGHDPFVVANEYDWPPFDFVRDGKPAGYSIDLIKLMAQKTGMQLDFVSDKTWSEFLELFKEGKIDIMPAIYTDKERSEWMEFTKSYYKQPTVIVIDKSNEKIQELDDLSGVRLAVQEGFVITTTLKEQFPESEFIYCNGIADALRKVSLGEADALLESIGVVSYIVNDQYIPNLKFIYDNNLKALDSPPLHMAVTKDNLMLLEILNKGLKAITPEEQSKILARWMPEMRPTESKISERALEFQWGFIALGVGLLVLIIIGVRLISPKMFKREEFALNFASKSFKIFNLGALGFIIIAVSTLSYFAIDHVHKNIMIDLQISLENTLENTNSRVNIWVDQRLSFLKEMNMDEELVTITAELLETPESDLIGSEALEKARAYILAQQVRLNFTNFFIVGPGNQNFASMSDRFVGKQNQIEKHSPGITQKIINGQTVFIPPVPFLIESQDTSYINEIVIPSIFFCSPIKSRTGKVIAAIFIQVDPSQSFSRIFQLSKIGETGECYAFNKEGHLLSASRFEDHLEELQLIQKQQTSILNIKLIDPGINLLESVSVQLPKEQKLTLMAQNAIQGLRGVNTIGYRDYRGVPVFGAWMWNEEIGIGLAAEIDVAEATGTFNTIRDTTLFVIFLALAITISLLMVAQSLGEKATTALLSTKENLESKVEERTFELKEKAKELNKQAAALNSAANGIAITNIDGIVEWVNPAFTKLTGYELEEIVGKRTDILKSGIHDVSFYKNLWQTITKGNVWQGEIINKKKNGDHYTEEMTITPVKDDKQSVLNYVAIKQDITERKILENKVEKANKRMSQELDVAKEIQMSMIPLTFPAFPERKEIDVFASLIPAREVGGDFYDFFWIDNSHFCFSIGDVSGKGVPAALMMAVTRTLLKSTASNEISVASILTHVNNEIARENSNYMFITLFMAIVDVNSGIMTYASAGHNPPYIFKKQSGALVTLNKLHGVVIGAMEGLPYSQDEVQLEAGDIFFGYTDGVTEAMDENNKLYSDPKLKNLLENHSFKSCKDLVNTVVNDVQSYERNKEQTDDITVLSFQFLGMPSVGDSEFSMNIKNDFKELPKVIEKIKTFSNKHELSGEIIKKVMIVFDEILNNIISYAYDDDNEHEIGIKLNNNGIRLIITISDTGKPFNPFVKNHPDVNTPLEKREIGGLGIMMVKKLVSEHKYNRFVNNNITTLILNL